MIRRIAAFVCALSSSALACALAPAAAAADEASARALSAGLIAPADDALKRALQPRTVAQYQPGQPQAPTTAPALPTGLTWTLDASSAFAIGKTGAPNGSRLAGGMDAVVEYGFKPHFRVALGYFELSEYPIGFDTGVVPLNLQGFGQIGTADLSNPAQDVSVKNHIFTASAQLLLTPKVGSRIVPIVIAPSYYARWGTIGGHDDTQLIEYNGFPTITRLRTEQSYLVAFTVPFVSTPRVFAAVTAAPQWLVHPAGVNQDNHAQIFELLYAEYRATKHDTIWIQPSRLLDYLPNDPYTEYVPTVLAGISHRFNRWAFVQVQLQSGAATNRSPYGVTALTCQRLPCAPSQVAPTLGGLHATQVQIQYGLGSPTVIPL